MGECIPGWPLEWVSAKGRYEGKTESLVLVHFAGAFFDREKKQKSLLLTAKDRRRRSWTAAVTMDEGPLLIAFERTLARKLNNRLADIGAVPLEIVEFPQRVEPRRKSAKLEPGAELDSRQLASLVARMPRPDMSTGTEP